jgi:hypothetical protein
VEGGIDPRVVSLQDDLALALEIAPDGALTGRLSATVKEGSNAERAAEWSSAYLKRRLDYWWLPPGIFTDGFRFEVSDGTISMPVRIEPTLVEAITAGLRIAMRFR